MSDGMKKVFEEYDRRKGDKPIRVVHQCTRCDLILDTQTLRCPSCDLKDFG